MNRTAWTLILSLALAAASLWAGDPAQAQPGGQAFPINVARFEGRWIDLSKGWEGARACAVYPGRATACFRTSRALAASEASLGSPLVSCSTPLTLHNGTNQTGTYVLVYTRGLWINLSTLSFDNMTSSFKVGACSIDMASGSLGSGSRYPRCLYAGCVENVMASGWDNVVSSVYLH